MNTLAEDKQGGESQKPEGSDYTSLMKSLFFPFAFVFVLWLIQLVQLITGIPLFSMGVIPRSVEGLTGIFTAPLIHAGSDHLLANTLPLLVAGTGLFYFYPTLSGRVIMMVWLFSGTWVWLAGRYTSHVGASGLIYGLVCFLFFSGIIRKAPRLIAFSLLITFLYGGLVWGIFPVLERVSWESHLFGAVAGTICAFYFRKEGPQRPKAQWEIEEEMEQEETQIQVSDEVTFTEQEDDKANNPKSDPLKIRYHYRNSDETNASDEKKS